MKVLRPNEVADRLGVSEMTLNRLRHGGDFPDPVRISRQCVGFIESEVNDWIQSRPRAQLAGTNGDGR